jgi:hypothetical protein
MKQFQSEQAELAHAVETAQEEETAAKLALAQAEAVMLREIEHISAEQTKQSEYQMRYTELKKIASEARHQCSIAEWMVRAWKAIREETAAASECRESAQRLLEVEGTSKKAEAKQRDAHAQWTIAGEAKTRASRQIIVEQKRVADSTSAY